jgi:trehalose synthase
MGFRRLKEGAARSGPMDLDRRLIAATRRLLAGPAPEAVSDDPEGVVVLEEPREAGLALPGRLRNDIALIALPMESLDQNALAVNALQRSSTLVVQNSIREGFGLTATEAMWKQVPVMVASAAGLRQQARDEIDGRVVCDLEDPQEIARTLAVMLQDERGRESWGGSGRRSVYGRFLIFPQLATWISILARAADGV